MESRAQLQKSNKFEKDFKLTSNEQLTGDISLLRLRPADSSFLLKDANIQPGQFVEVQISQSPTTFLRRPISVNFVDEDANELLLLVRNAGAGTNCLRNLPLDSILNIVLPLGNGFSMVEGLCHPLLVGGGVGVAPLLYLGTKLMDKGVKPTFLLAAKSASELTEMQLFSSYGDVIISTDDGSAGTPGLVTANPALSSGQWDYIYCCGPLPMMKGVAKIAQQQGITCEVSLENMMACGLGACLCCVEDTKDKGNVCVCKEGPVFDSRRLKWFD